MPDQKSTSLPPDKILAHLQETLLVAVLSGQSLPGSDNPIRFPDLSFVLQQPKILLLDENLAGSISLKDSPVPVRIISRDDLQKEAHAEGDRAYLHFRPPQGSADSVRLTLEASIATQNPAQRTLGLSSMNVSFQKVGNRWQVGDEPAMLAS